MRIGADVTSQRPAANDGQKQAKLVDAAQQFETSLLQELLKPMQHGQNSWGGEVKSDDSASDTISSFGTEAIAKDVHGFGVPDQLEGDQTNRRCQVVVLEGVRVALNRPNDQVIDPWNAGE